MGDQDKLQPMRLAIGGERFQIQTDLSEVEIGEIVAYIEDKMKDHLVPGLRTEPRKQLILMAMEIASDLFETRKRLQQIENEVDQKASKLFTMLDQATSGLPTHRVFADGTVEPPEQEAGQDAKAFLD